MNPPSAPPPTLGALTTVLSNFLAVAISLTGAAVVVMLVMGGLQFLMAGGDKEATQKAGKTITLAVTGLVIILCSWLVILMIGQFLGLDLSTYTFSVCLPGYSGVNCSQ